VAAEVQLGWPDTQGRDPLQLMEEVVVDVMKACERRGFLPDPALVRELVAREWAEYADARVQTYLPVLIGRSVRARVLCGGTPDGVPTPAAVVTTASGAGRRDHYARPGSGC
jgi:hypothetical protein